MRLTGILTSLVMIIAFAGCTPDKAMDFGVTGEIDTAPQDQLSQQQIDELERQYADR